MLETYYTERLMSTEEVANTLGWSQWKVRKWVRDGKITPVMSAYPEGKPKRGRKTNWFTLSAIQHCRES
jgi:hypothetical protein